MTEQHHLHTLSSEQHVLWCRRERESMIRELIKYKARTVRHTEWKIEKSLTQGATTHVAYLKSAIRHLDTFIAARSPRRRRQPRQTSAAGESLQ
jgi:hypothetical protein